MSAFQLFVWVPWSFGPWSVVCGPAGISAFRFPLSALSFASDLRHFSFSECQRVRISQKNFLPWTADVQPPVLV